MKRLNLAAISTLFVLFFSNAAISATYYVSPSGSDSNVGSLTAPFKTLAKPACLVNPGDTVIASKGVYYENYQAQGVFGLLLSRGGTASNPILFMSASPGGAIIDGNNTVQIGVYIPANYVQIQGFQMRNFSREGVSVHGQYATITGNIVHNNGSDTTVSPSIGHNGIYTDQNATNCMVNGNIVYGNGRLSLGPGIPYGSEDQGVYLCSPNSTVQNNLIYGNQAYGIQIAGYVSLGSVLITNNTIVTQQTCGGIIIWQTGAKGCVIQNNTVTNNAGYGLDFYGDGGGHVVQNNIFYGNVAGGIDPLMSTQYTGSNNLVAP